MLHQNIPLTIDYAAAGLSGTAQATLTTYVITHEREMDKIVSRPAVVVCPGGGYAGAAADRPRSVCGGDAVRAGDRR